MVVLKLVCFLHANRVDWFCAHLLGCINQHIK